jgi:YD repeat-containing protein
MRKLVLATATLAALALPAAAQTQQRVYDSAGRSVGTSSTGSSGQTRFYDAQGRSLGTSSTDSQGTTRFYDARGRSLGTITAPRR